MAQTRSMWTGWSSIISEGDMGGGLVVSYGTGEGTFGWSVFRGGGVR